VAFPSTIPPAVPPTATATPAPTVVAGVGAWRQLAPLPLPRSEVAGAVLDGRLSGVIDGRWIVVGGGPNPDLSATDRVDAWVPH
jgi:hypothetical protein